MLTFTWPWLLALLPLPWLYRLWRKPLDRTPAALRAPAYQQLAGESRSTAIERATWLPTALLLIIWLGLLLAATRPTWVGDPVALPVSGRDLLLAVDISESMKVEDMQFSGGVTSRLNAVKAVVGDFVERRQGDRLGLILFGTQAYLQTPLTFDRHTLNKLLQEAQIGFAGGSTAIGDAIGIAIKRLQSRPKASQKEPNRVLILLSDGADTASEVPPLQAAELAAAEKMTIYTIGIGADEIIRRSFFGNRRFNPSADLDERMLKAIADKTGGQYFRARNPQELAAIYEELDRLEPVEQEAETLRPTKALFYWPLGVALIASFLLVIINWAGLNRTGNPHG